MFQYAEHTVAGLRDVNQDIPGEEVTLLSGWLSVLRRTIGNRESQLLPPFPSLWVQEEAVPPMLPSK